MRYARQSKDTSHRSSRRPGNNPGLASDVRLSILGLLHTKSANINEIAEELSLPQSTVATNVATLERAGLVMSDIVKAKKGNQKICRAVYEELVIRFNGDEKRMSDDLIEVEMPIRLFTSYEVRPLAGLLVGWHHRISGRARFLPQSG